MKLRRILNVLLAAALIASLVACEAATAIPPASEGARASAPAPGSNAHLLDGKKIIFIGCSYTYYGGVVINSANTVLTQAEREDDQGFFYQLCKANGAQVSVTDWCYGGHDLTDLFDGSCNADRGHDGFDHLAELKERAYDYVVFQDIQISGWKTEDYVESAKGVMEVFRTANPGVKFFYMMHDGAYANNYPAHWKDAIPVIRDLGVTIVDWGTLVWDVIHRAVSVPGAQLEYQKNSFLVSDGYHPNLLSGYLCALMTYCAITGETAVGQDYSFCITDPVSSYVDPEQFIKNYYNKNNPLTIEDERKTNFVQVFESQADMNGLQQLADQYLTQESKLDRHYTVTFCHEDGSVIKSSEYCYGETLIWPPKPTKPADENNTYIFLDWGAPDVCLGDATYTARFGAKPIRK